MGLKGSSSVERYLTLPEQFDSACKKFSDRDAFSHLGKSISFLEWHQHSLTLANWLSQQDLVAGDTVGVVLPNILQFPIIAQAVFRAGLILVPVNPIAKQEDLDLIYSQTRLKVVFFLDLFESCLKPLLSQKLHTKWVRCNLGDFTLKGKRLKIESWRRYFSKSTLMDAGIEALSFRDLLGVSTGKNTVHAELRLKNIPVERDGSKVVMIFYTQGTTGQIKGVCLTHQNLLANSNQVQDWLKRQSIVDTIDPYKVMAPMPLFYSYGFLTHCILMPEIGMHSVLVADPLDSKRLIKTIKHYKPDILVAMAPILKKLMSDKLFKTLDLRSLKITLTAGSWANEQVSDSWFESTGCKVTNAYGLTEATAAVAMMDIDKSPAGSVGKAVTDCQIKIMRSDSIAARTGEVGEITVSGPQVFSGYLAAPDQTAMALNENWLRTGDLGYLDENGWLFLVDRKKDVLHQSGYQVYPNEIEQVVNRFPGIQRAAAIGIPAPNKEEHIVLLIVTSDPNLNLGDLLRFCRSNLASYKVPKIIEVREDLPISSMGVVKKNRLKIELLEKLKV